MDTCSDCGAEPYMGGSHFKVCAAHKQLHPRCCDGVSADQYWRTVGAGAGARPRHWNEA